MGMLDLTDAGKYKLIADNTSDFIIIFDSFGHVKYASPSHAELFGPQQLENQIIAHYIHPEDFDNITKCFEEIFTKKMQSTAEFRHKKGDGWVFLEARGAPILNDEGMVEAALIVARDITERKKIEIMLSESEKRYRRLLNMLPEPIIIHCDGIIVYLNEASQQVFNAENQSDVLGKSVIDFLHPDSKKAAAKRLEQLSKGTRGNSYYEYDLVSLNGQVRRIEAVSSPIEEMSGGIFVQTVFRDITDRKKTEEMLRRSDKLSALGQMAAGIAHEIRNPLTSLKGFVQLLQHKHGDPSGYYEIMGAELERINTIVNEFMRIAKPQPAEFETKHPDAIVENVCALMEPQAILNNIELMLHISNGTSDIYCDEHQLKQVFINLLKNAMEAMQRGGRITVQVYPEKDNRTGIIIMDEGPGIPEKYLSKLGEPFFTTKENGTGLGLMVCHKIIQDHRGHIEIKSEEGKGTTVFIRLPGKH